MANGMDVADEELRLLEAMAALNQVLVKLNRQTVELSTELRTAERQTNALYLPFQAAIYEIQSASNKTAAAAAGAATTPGVSRQFGQRTDL